MADPGFCTPFSEKGFSARRRPDLTGGGLLRSSGGRRGLKGFRKAGIRVKGDERILVAAVLWNMCSSRLRRGEKNRKRESVSPYSQITHNNIDVPLYFLINTKFTGSVSDPVECVVGLFFRSMKFHQRSQIKRAMPGDPISF
jgi:hypothetical protein